LKLPAHVLFRKELSLLVWKPHGILDQALVNEILALRRVYAPLLAEGKAMSGKWTAPALKRAG
jgi:hypothetical protein